MTQIQYKDMVINLINTIRALHLLTRCQRNHIVTTILTRRGRVDVLSNIYKGYTHD